MSVPNYGVLKGKAKNTRNGQGTSPHFQVLVSDHDQFRIAINVKSDVEPSTVLYYVDEHFEHPVLKDLVTLPLGFHSLESKPGGMASDFIRGNLFDTGKMKTCPITFQGRTTI